MTRDYSWDDQDPEQMQTWHEFQGGLDDPLDTDSLAFPHLDKVSEIAWDLGDDEQDLEEKLQDDFTEVDEEIHSELSKFLTPDEVIVICCLKGIYYEQRGLFEIATNSKVPLGDVEEIFNSAAEKLHKTQKYQHWFEN